MGQIGPNLRHPVVKTEQRQLSGKTVSLAAKAVNAVGLRFRVAVALAGLLPLAQAKQVVITITGKVVSGTDQTGVFGFQPNTPLNEQRAILTYFFDDTNALENVASCPDGTPYFSSVASTDMSNPGTAVLPIGGSTFAFGALPVSSISSEAHRYIPFGSPGCGTGYSNVYFKVVEYYDVTFADGSRSIGPGSVQAQIYSADGSPPLSMDYDWRAAFTRTGDLNTEIQFVISRSILTDPPTYQIANGEIIADSITVSGSDGCPLAANNPPQIRALPTSARDIANGLATLSYPNGNPVIDPNTGQPYPVPPGMDISNNVARGAGATTLDMILWFGTGGSEDYQRPDGLIPALLCQDFQAKYTDVTLYNYGAVAAAAGYSLTDTLVAAGFYNQWLGNPANTNPMGLRPNAWKSISQGWTDQRTLQLWGVVRLFARTTGRRLPTAINDESPQSGTLTSFFAPVFPIGILISACEA